MTRFTDSIKRLPPFILSKAIATTMTLPKLSGYVTTKVLGGHLRNYILHMPGCEQLGYIVGQYEPHVVQALQKYLEPNMVCYDVGAHIGYHALTMSQLVGETGQVIAFEASPTNYQALQANIAVNHAHNIQAIPNAVADQSGSIHFATFSYSLVGHIATANTPADRTLEEVDAISIDDFVFNHHHPAPDLIKIDVEGAEARVFAGLTETMRYHRPIILAEVRDEYMQVLAGVANKLNYTIQILKGTWSMDEHGLVDLLVLPI